MDIEIIEKKLNIIPSGYVGSKKQKISWMHKCLKNEGINLRDLCVFDAFSGTGSFSYYSKLSGARDIIANDFLISSALYVKTFVENPGITLSEDEINYLIYNKNNRKTPFVQENYAGKDNYFHKKEAVFLDNYRANIDDLFEKKGKLSECLLDKFVASSINFHKDKILKFGYKQAAALTAIMSMISSWFGGGAGKFSSPSYNSRKIFTISRKRAKRKDRPFIGKELVLDYLKYSRSSLNKITKCIESSTSNAIVLNADTLILLQDSIFARFPIDIIYVDLPYGGEHSDYFKLYGLIESYVLRKPTMQLHYLNDANYFNSRKNYEIAFVRLLGLIKTRKINKWVFSFNNSSWESKNKIVHILKDFSKKIKIYQSEHCYRYRKEENRKGNEYLIICN